MKTKTTEHGQRPSDIELFGVDKSALTAALKAAVDDGTITEDEMSDALLIVEKMMGV